MSWSRVKVESPRIEYDSGSSQITYSYRTDQQNLKTVFYEWPATEESANGSLRPVIILVHGICVHARFEWMDFEPVINVGDSKPPKEAPRKLVYSNSWVDRFTKLGYDVYAQDLQGHGESEGFEGRRAAVEDFDDYSADVLEFMHIINDRINGDVEKLVRTPKSAKKSKKPQPSRFYRPIFLAGISLGGCIVLRTAELLEREFQRSSSIMVSGKEENDVDYRLLLRNYDAVFLRRVLRGCILLAPMLCLKTIKAQPLNRFLLNLVGIADKIIPHANLTSVTDNPKFPYMVAAKYADPLTYKNNISVRTANQNMRAVDVALEEAKKIGEPLPLSDEESSAAPNLVKLGRNPAAFCMLHSIHDTMCDHEGSQMAHDALVHVLHKEVSLLDAEGLWHSLSNEPSNGLVFREMAKWLDEVQRRLNDSNTEEYELLRMTREELLEGADGQKLASPKALRVRHADTAATTAPDDEKETGDKLQEDSHLEHDESDKDEAAESATTQQKEP